jgi:hypothetical protein
MGTDMTTPEDDWEGIDHGDGLGLFKGSLWVALFFASIVGGILVLRALLG